MCLGAFVDAGVPLSVLKKGLRQLNISGYQLKAKKVHRGSIYATKVDVNIQQGFEKPLSLTTIRRIIKHSSLSSTVKSSALEVFRRLAEAEGTVHGKEPSKVHFHEVGVIDSLVDIVGTFPGHSASQYYDMFRFTYQCWVGDHSVCPWHIACPWTCRC